MPRNESPPPAGDISRDSKGSSRTRWKGKLFSGEGWRKTSHGSENNSTDVDDFLGSSGPKPPEKPDVFVSDGFARTPSIKVDDKTQHDDGVDRFLHHHPSPESAESRLQPRPSPGTSMMAPRLDMTGQQGQVTAALESDLGPIKDTYRRAKPRMNKGLTVIFVSSAPEIIGEGGDEAELPSREISKSMPKKSMNGAAQALPLRRRSTGIGVPETSDLPVIRSQYVNVNEATTREPQLPNIGNLELPRSPKNVSTNDSQNVAGYDAKPSHTIPNPRVPFIARKATAQSKARSDSLDLPKPEPPADPAGNSLTPIPSPLPLNVADKSGSHYGFPRTPSRGTSPSASNDRRDKSVNRDIEKARSGSAPDIKPFSLRSVAKALGHDALDEFDGRVRGVFSLFRLGVGAQRDPNDLPFAKWVFIAAWWFLKGRMELESAVRSKPKNSHEVPENYVPRSLVQAYIDLAKAWWIVDDINASHPEVLKYGSASMASLVAVIENFGDRNLAAMVEINIAIIANMRALAMSMKRNNRLPPDPFEVQGLDTYVLLTSPPMSPTYAKLLMNPRFDPSGNIPVFPMPIGDTAEHFCLGRMFSKLSLMYRPNNKAEIRMPSLISIVQTKKDADFGALIATQDGQVSISIRSERARRSDFTWKLIQWITDAHSMILPLSRELDLMLELSDRDYKTIWSMCDHSQKIQRDFGAQEDETMVFDCNLHHFERLEMPNEPGGFPQGSIKDCHLRLFAKKLRSLNSTRQTMIHAGFRLVVLTGPSVKSPRILRADLSSEKLILFGPARREDGPCLTLRMLDFPTLLLAFRTQEELEAFRLVTISGGPMTDEDHSFAPLPLQGFNVAIHPTEDDPSGFGAKDVAALNWHQIQLVERPNLNSDQSSDGSASLRIQANCDYGSLIDRLSMDVGELKICVGLDDMNEIRLLRPPQPDITWILEDRLHRDVIQSLARKLKGMTHSFSVRTYEFSSIDDAHAFQAAVTGFPVRFDGVVSSFSFQRRRMVLQKKVAATSTRVQLLQQDPQSCQVAAFFKEYEQGSCMSFVVKDTDVFETSSKSGSYLLRIADAKFALPKTGANAEKDFLCLEVPEYPTEHDDITIGFDNEEGMFAKISVCLMSTRLIDSQNEIGS